MTTDLTSFQKIMDEVPPEIKPMIPDFLKRREQDVSDLRDKLEHSDFNAIRDIGHRLKGTGGGYGIQLISVIGGDMESAGLKKHFEGAERAIKELEIVTLNLKRVLNL